MNDRMNEIPFAFVFRTQLGSVALSLVDNFPGRQILIQECAGLHLGEFRSFVLDFKL